MTQHTNKTEATIFDEKTESLIALGAAAACNCIPCFEHLYEKAVTCGLTIDQIKRASMIADQVKKGARNAILSSVNELTGDTETVDTDCFCTQTASASCCG